MYFIVKKQIFGDYLTIFIFKYLHFAFLKY